MAAQDKLDPHLTQWAFQAGSRVLMTFAIVQGVNIVLSGPVPWGGPAFATAMRLPGAPPSWGIPLALMGIIALAGSLRGRYRPVIVGMYCSGIWCMFFAIGFTRSHLDNPTAGNTGIYTYFAIASLYIGAAAIYSRSRSLHYASRGDNEAESPAVRGVHSGWRGTVRHPTSDG